MTGNYRRQWAVLFRAAEGRAAGVLTLSGNYMTLLPRQDICPRGLTNPLSLTRKTDVHMCNSPSSPPRQTEEADLAAARAGVITDAERALMVFKLTGWS